jgi:hypothetical protein
MDGCRVQISSGAHPASYSKDTGTVADNSSVQYGGLECVALYLCTTYQVLEN